ncbi:hypothetical protein ACFQY4_27665 [Catellatospora bangladeshensis]
MILPTDGLWRGAMYAFQDPILLSPQLIGHPLVGDAPLAGAYLGWAAVWVALVLGLAALAFQRRDL